MLRQLIRLRAWLAGGLFACLLIAPMAAGVFAPRGAVSDLENRELASAPRLALAVSDWPAYARTLNAWMTDHMGLRDWMIGIYFDLRSDLNLAVERAAVEGEDGWLFASVDDALAMHEGLRPFDRDEAAAWLSGAAETAAAATRAGAAFAVLIPPNKHEVYPEHLPRHAPRTGAPRRAETLAAAGPAAGVRVIYPLADLLRKKPEGQLYFKTDTHWTELGAYWSYRALMDELAAMGVRAPVVAPTDLEIGPPEAFAGDIYPLLGRADGRPEPIRRYKIRTPTTYKASPAPALDWMSFEAETFIMPDRNRPKILVYGDSYFSALAPFLRESFDEVAFVHHRLGAPPRAALDDASYDVVLLQMVERFLTYDLAVEQ